MRAEGEGARDQVRRVVVRVVVVRHPPTVDSVRLVGPVEAEPGLDDDTSAVHVVGQVVADRGRVCKRRVAEWNDTGVRLELTQRWRAGRGVECVDRRRAGGQDLRDQRRRRTVAVRIGDEDVEVATGWRWRRWRWRRRWWRGRRWWPTDDELLHAVQPGRRVDAPARSDHRVADSHARSERARCDQRRRRRPGVRRNVVLRHVGQPVEGRESRAADRIQLPLDDCPTGGVLRHRHVGQLIGGRPRVRCAVVAPGVAEDLIGIRATTRHVELAVDHTRGGSGLARDAGLGVLTANEFATGSYSQVWFETLSIVGVSKPPFR